MHANMKKINVLTNVLIVALVAGLACSINNESGLEPNTDMLSLEEIKLIHRVAMEQAKNNFIPNERLTSLDAKIDFVSSFTKESIGKMDLSDYQVESLNFALEENKNMVVRFEYTSLSRQKIVSTDQFEIIPIVVDDLETSRLFSSSEINLVRRISHSFELAVEGNIPPTSIEDSISIFRTFYKDLEPASDESKYTVGIILAIAEESYDWWSKNPDAIISTDGKSKAILIPTIVAQDVAGAIIGAGVAAGYQAYQNDGDFDWEAVGYGTVTGAVVASTGAVTRLGNWIYGLIHP